MPKIRLDTSVMNPKRVLVGLALIFGGVFLSWQSVLLSIAAVADETNPDLVLSFAPNNSLALSSKGDLIWTTNAEKAGDPIVAELGRKALRAQSLNAPAIRLLAVSEQMKGNTVKADKLIGLATKVTRRDMLAQLWLVQQALAKGNAKGAFQHYNIALRTNAGARSFLFPQMAALLEDSDYHLAFSPYLSRGAIWMPEFLNYVIWNSDHNPALATAILASPGMPKNDAQYRSFETQIISQLVTKHEYSLAQRFYLRLNGATPNTFKSVALNATTTDAKFAPISWRIDAGAGAGASIIERAGKFEIAALANAANSGLVAQKMLFLSSGRYKLYQFADIHSLGKGASATWIIRCMYNSDSRVVWRLQINKSMNSKNTFADFQIPAGCSNQFIELAIIGGDDPEGVDMSLSRLNIIPIG